MNPTLMLVESKFPKIYFSTIRHYDDKIMDPRRNRIKCALNDVNPVACRVTLDTFCNAIEIGEYFREQAIYAYSLGDIDLGTIKAERLVQAVPMHAFQECSRLCRNNGDAGGIRLSPP